MTSEELALNAIHQEQVILHNTDTVPGLACSALSDHGLSLMRRIKGRAETNPFLILCADKDMLGKLVEIPKAVRPLIELSSQVPITLIYQSAKVHVNPGIESLAVRIPCSQRLRSFIEKADRPLASSSANKSGGATPRSLDEVSQIIKDEVAFVFDEAIVDSAYQGQASNILRVMGSGMEWVRKGSGADEVARHLDHH